MVTFSLLGPESTGLAFVIRKWQLCVPITGRPQGDEIDSSSPRVGPL